MMNFHDRDLFLENLFALVQVGRPKLSVSFFVKHRVEECPGQVFSHWYRYSFFSGNKGNAQHARINKTPEESENQIPAIPGQI